MVSRTVSCAILNTLVLTRFAIKTPLPQSSITGNRAIDRTLPSTILLLMLLPVKDDVCFPFPQVTETPATTSFYDQHTAHTEHGKTERRGRRISDHFRSRVISVSFSMPSHIGKCLSLLREYRCARVCVCVGISGGGKLMRHGANKILDQLYKHKGHTHHTPHRNKD